MHTVPGRNADSLADSAGFWSGAPDKSIATPDQDGDGGDAELETTDSEPIILLPRAEHESGVHLDIESGEVTDRAPSRPLAGHGTPAGHCFCVARPQRKTLGPHLNRWEQAAAQKADNSTFSVTAGAQRHQSSWSHGRPRQ